MSSKDRTEAWTIGDYGRVAGLKLNERTRPVPGIGQILIEVEAAALNPLDLKLMSGDLREFMPLQFPFVPGSDVCGRVIATGDGVKAYKIGDRVAGLTPSHGGMARHALLSEGPSTSLLPSEGAGTDYASLPEAGMTALAVLRAAGIRAGFDLAIIGATGGVGLAICQLASSAGAHVIATAGEGDQELVRANGALDVVDYRNGDTIDELLERRPQGLPVLIDLINQFDGLMRTAKAVAPGGVLVSTLFGPDPAQFPAGIRVRYIRLSPEEGDLDRLVALSAANAFRANVSAVFEFADVPKAYLALRDGHVRGKIAVAF